VDAGTYSVTAHYAGDANHQASDGSPVAVTINKAASVTVVAISGGPFTYTGAAQTPATVMVTGAGGLILAPTAAYQNNVNAGTATASYAYVGDANHYGSSDSKTFAIGKTSSTTVTAGAGPFTYDGTAHSGGSGTVTGAGGLSTGATSLTYSGDQVDAGTYSVTAHYAGDANHQASDGSPVAVTINKASSATVVAGGTFTYDGSPHGGSNAQVSGAGVVTGSATLSYSGTLADGTTAYGPTANAPVNAGTYYVTATYAGDANHAGSVSTPAAITINRAALTVTAGNKTKVYGDPNPALTASYGGFATGEGPTNLPVPVTLSTAATPSSVAGSYAITASGPAADGNYSVTYVSGTLTVTARAAFASYIGQQVVATSGSGSTTAQVALSASIQDPTGSSPNHSVTTATVTFLGQDMSSPNSGWVVLASRVPVKLVQNTDTSIGTANTVVTLSTGQWGIDQYMIRVQVSDSYFGTNAQQDGTGANAVTVQQPSATDSLRGSGSISYLGAAAGTYLPDQGSQTSYLFGVGYNKSGTSLQGGVTLSYKRTENGVAYRYYIKSNSLASLTVTPGTGSLSGTESATFYAKASVYKVALDANGNETGPTISVDGGVTLRVDAFDGKLTANKDQVGFTVLSKTGELYYANNWAYDPISKAWRTLYEDVTSPGIVDLN
jgi:hypothetical protein